jgi:hypothetical protein
MARENDSNTLRTNDRDKKICEKKVQKNPNSSERVQPHDTDVSMSTYN